VGKKAKIYSRLRGRRSLTLVPGPLTICSHSGRGTRLRVPLQVPPPNLPSHHHPLASPDPKISTSDCVDLVTEPSASEYNRGSGDKRDYCFESSPPQALFPNCAFPAASHFARRVASLSIRDSCKKWMARAAASSDRHFPLHSPTGLTAPPHRTQTPPPSDASMQADILHPPHTLPGPQIFHRWPGGIAGMPDDRN
jgi:hypothetical protein